MEEPVDSSSPQPLDSGTEVGLQRDARNEADISIRGPVTRHKKAWQAPIAESGAWRAPIAEYEKAWHEPIAEYNPVETPPLPPEVHTETLP